MCMPSKDGTVHHLGLPPCLHPFFMCYIIIATIIIATAVQKAARFPVSGSSPKESSIYSKESSISFQALRNILKARLQLGQWQVHLHVCVSFAMEYHIYNESSASISKKKKK